MLRRAPLAASVVVGLLSLSACDEADRALGSPCEMHEDCPEPLICDVHDEEGSCQQPHDHEQAEYDLGAPCTEDADCDAPMICDVHDEQGWCSPPHEHDTETDG